MISFYIRSVRVGSIWEGFRWQISARLHFILSPDYTVIVMISLNIYFMTAFTNPGVIPQLDLVQAQDQITHNLDFQQQLKGQQNLNFFRADPNYQKTQQQWDAIKLQILDQQNIINLKQVTTYQQQVQQYDKQQQQGIKDLTQQDLINLRRTIYLAIQSTVNFQQCAHKILKMKIKGYQSQSIDMIIQCCMMERIYQEFLGIQRMTKQFQNPDMRQHYSGLFPIGHPNDVRFAINYWTTIGLGPLTEQLREVLQLQEQMIADRRQRLQQERMEQLMREEQQMLMAEEERTLQQQRLKIQQQQRVKKQYQAVKQRQQKERFKARQRERQRQEQRQNQRQRQSSSKSKSSSKNNRRRRRNKAAQILIEKMIKQINKLYSLILIIFTNFQIFGRSKIKHIDYIPYNKISDTRIRNNNQQHARSLIITRITPPYKLQQFLSNFHIRYHKLKHKIILRIFLIKIHPIIKRQYIKFIIITTKILA